MLPLVRLLFIMALGLINWSMGLLIFRFNENYILSDDGYKSIVNDHPIALILEIIVLVFRLFISLFLLFKFIQVPHEKDPNHKIQNKLDDSYRFTTLEALACLVVGTSGSITVSQMFHELDFLGTILESEGVLQTSTYLRVLRMFYLCIILLLILIGACFAIYNVFHDIFAKQLKSFSSKSEFAFFFAELIVYLVGWGFTIKNNVVFYSIDIPNHHEHHEMHDYVVLEMTIHIIAEHALSFSLISLVCYHYLVDIPSESVKLADKYFFRSIFFGLYTSALASWREFEANKGEMNALVYIPIGVYFTIQLITIVKLNSDIFQDMFEVWDLFALRVFNKKVSVAWWKLAIALGILGLVNGLIAIPVEWMTLSISPGTFPRNIEGVINTIEDDIENAGHIAFNAIKQLDPCRWSGPDDEKDVNYSYEVNGKNKTRSYSFKATNVDNIQCKTKGTDHSTCKDIEDAQQRAQDKKMEKDRFVQDTEFAKFDEMTSFNDMTSSSGYREKLESCHVIECDVVMATAVTSELALLSGDLLSFLPFVGESVDTAAYFAQQANRIGHTIIKWGISLAKFIYNMRYRLKQWTPMITIFKKLASYSEKVAYAPGAATMIIFAPLLTNGFFCVLAGAWKRNGIQNSVKEFTFLIYYFFPNFLANTLMFTLSYIFPILLEAISGQVPKTILEVSVKEEYGMFLIRAAFLFGTLSSLLLLFSLTLHLIESLEKTLTRILSATLRPFRNLYTRIFTDYSKVGVIQNSRATLVENTCCGLDKYIDSAWLQSFLINLIAISLCVFSLTMDYEAINFVLTPTSGFLKILGSIKEHTEFLIHSGDVKEVSTSNLCGIIGQATKSVVYEVANLVVKTFENLIISLEKFTDGILHFTILVDVFEDVGHIILNVFDSTWRFAENTFFLIVPIVNTILSIFGGVVKGYYNRRQDLKDEGKLITNAIVNLQLILCFYNIIAIILIMQLASSMGYINLILFNFKFDAGNLLYVSLYATIINIISIGSIIIENIYSLR